MRKMLVSSCMKEIDKAAVKGHSVQMIQCYIQIESGQKAMGTCNLFRWN